MMDIDKEIERALSEEDKLLVSQFEDLGLFSYFKSLFRGKDAWVSILSIFFGIILQVLFFYCAYKFFTIADMNSKILWGGGAWFTAIMVAFMKVWFWMRMESNRVIREIKRLELRVTQMQLSQVNT